MAGILLPAYEQGRWVVKGRLAANPDGTAALGRWGRLGCHRPFTLTVAPLSASGLISSVQLYVSNGIAEPPALVSAGVPLGGAPLGQPMTTPQSLSYDLPYEWICAVIAAGGNATVIDLAAG
jgi:hypothetical protein